MNKDKTAIILSSAYIEQEMSSELGLLPPAFLPVGAKQLFELQADFLQEFTETIYLTIPQSFTIDEITQETLNKKNINILYIPDNLSLNKALSQALQEITKLHHNIKSSYVLLGDTLIDDFKIDFNNFLTVSPRKSFHNWAVLSSELGKEVQLSSEYNSSNNTNSDYIVSGFFAFNNIGCLLQCLDAKSSFIQALNTYSQNSYFISLECKKWYDFGHLSTYHQSKCNMATARAFNNITSNGVTFSKLSNQFCKISAETYWYSNLPLSMKIFTPKFIQPLKSINQVGYELEYLYLSTLAELYVFGKLPLQIWNNILDRCFNFLDECKKFKPSKGMFEYSKTYPKVISSYLFSEKTIQRLNLFQEQTDFLVDKELFYKEQKTPSLRDIQKKTADLIRPTETSDICLSHGDYFFGNMMFDFRANRVYVFDPRGLVGEACQTIYLDQRYDVAKLAHSILGAYDFIIANRYKLIHNKVSSTDNFELIININKKHQGIFLSRFSNHELKEIYAIMIQLFIAMLPLHKEDSLRQQAFVANILRLYLDMEEIK